MKTARIFLAVVALVLGFAGAVTSKTMADITNHGVRQNGTVEFPTVEQNQCDNMAPSGSQCSLVVSSGDNAAYKISAPSEPLLKP